MKLLTWTFVLGVLLMVALPRQVIAADTNSDGYEQILLPVAIPQMLRGIGAHGSVWSGEIWVDNRSNRDFRLQHPDGACAVPGGCAALTAPAGRVTKQVTVVVNRHFGAIYQVPANLADQVFVSTRIHESTGGAQPLGVEIPIVREAAFLRGSTEFLAIPIDPSNRIAVRVFDPRLIRGSTVRLDFFTTDGSVIGSLAMVPGNDPDISWSQASTLTYVPAQAVLFDLVAVVPQIASYDRIHMRVTPLTPGMEYWAMVSVTDNATQHVTILTPTGETPLPSSP